MSLVGNLTGRAKAEINERELKGSRWVPKRAFSSPLATTRLHARNEPTLTATVSAKNHQHGAKRGMGRTAGARGGRDRLFWQHLSLALASRVRKQKEMTITALRYFIYEACYEEF